MTLPIRIDGEPVLRSRARELEVDEIRAASIQRLIEEMVETMRAAPGVGLAAPQIGEPLRIVVVEDRLEYCQHLPPELASERERSPVPLYVLINPEIIAHRGEVVEHPEACLSIPGRAGLVRRYRSLVIAYLDRSAERKTVQASGWHARILQHEIDHLEGVLYVDRPDTLPIPDHIVWRQMGTNEIRMLLDRGGSASSGDAE